jgi:C-terminal processing protease CtpA/Prc
MHNFKLKRTYNLSQKEPLTFKWIDSEIAYVGIPNFASEDIVRQFDSLFNEIQKSKYLIIDIRENGGGNSNNGYEILGRLTDSTFATNSTVFKKYNPANRSWDNNAFEIEVLGYDWKPYKKNSYRNQVVLLTSALTYSAAEDFTVAFKYMKRGLIIGSPTGGSTGNPMSYDLPGGAKGFVCSKRELMPDGAEFIGKGIQPDVYVKETQQGICKGNDEVINEAIRIIHKNNNQNKSNEK